MFLCFPAKIAFVSWFSFKGKCRNSIMSEKLMIVYYGISKPEKGIKRQVLGYVRCLFIPLMNHSLWWGRCEATRQKIGLCLGIVGWWGPLKSSRTSVVILSAQASWPFIDQWGGKTKKISAKWWLFLEGLLSVMWLQFQFVLLCRKLVKLTRKCLETRVFDLNLN